MMKKLLILALVLGMASASYGGVAFSLSDFELWEYTPGTVTVVCVANPPALGLATTINGGFYDPSGGNFGDPLAILPTPTTAAAGALYGAIAGWPGYNGFDFAAGSTGIEDPPWNAATGDWFSVAYTGSAGDTVDVYDYAVSAMVPIGQLTIIPEPMTIALLGLGSLFLLRRRK